jgi:hypothetical protein
MEKAWRLKKKQRRAALSTGAARHKVRRLVQGTIGPLGGFHVLRHSVQHNGYPQALQGKSL